MIGFFDYTVWLTYASLISAVVGIFTCFAGAGHPYLGAMCLLFSGLCDAFDGKVARTKKDRTPMQKKYGIQIDSLADIIAFAVLPACIGAALYRTSAVFDAPNDPCLIARIPYPVYVAIFCVYVLAALIRLAYFNVTEEENQARGIAVRSTYTGLPVTSAAMIFPSFLLLQYLLPEDIAVAYYGCMLLTAVLFVSRFNVKKPGFKGILLMVGIGAIEFALIVVLVALSRRRLGC